MKTLPKIRLYLWLQWLAAAELIALTMMAGLISGWTSPYLAKLDEEKNPNSELPIDSDEASWIASLANLTRPVGAVLGAILVCLIGSKTSTLLSGVPFAVGWICFFFENSVLLVYASRVLSGIGLGMCYSTFPLYIGEISHPKIRGALVAMTMQGFLVGNLCGCIMGKYLKMGVFAAISLVPNLLFLASFSVMPHTPHYLVRCNMAEEAGKSILFYNRNADVIHELDALRQFMQINQTPTWKSKLRAINTPINRKTLLMISIIFALTQLSGLYTVSAYMEKMLMQAQVTLMDPPDLVIGVSVVSIVSSWLATYTTDRLGRTVMLLFSCFGIAVSMFLWGLNYQLLDLDYQNSKLQWLSIVAAIVYQFSLAIGVMSIPSTLVGEMYAPNVKAFGAFIGSGISGVFAFAASRSYQPMVDLLTEKYVFWIYAVLMISTGIYTIIFIPEPKGKSLVEIQEMLSTRKMLTKSQSNKLDIQTNITHI